MKNKEQILKEIHDHTGKKINANFMRENYFKKVFQKEYEDIIQFKETLKNKHLIQRFGELLYLYLYDWKEVKICKGCRKNKIKFIDFKNGYTNYCSSKCVHNDPEIIEKTKETNLKRHGAIAPLCSPLIKKKIEKTCLKKYGVTSPLASKEIREKIDITRKKKYGPSTYCRDRLFGTNLKKIEHLVEHNISRSEYLEKGPQGRYSFSCRECGFKFIDYLDFNGLPRCIKCYPIKTSFPEIELRKYIKELINNKLLINNRKLLKGKELDLYLPENKLAIEYNGMIFHSFGKNKYSFINNFLEESEQKNKHFNKTNLCEEKDINLLHINENEWLNPIKQDIWKSIISTKLGKNKRYFARNCYIKEITDNKIKNDFLNQSHLQGEDKSSIKLGLYSKNNPEFHNLEGEDKLLSIMTFGKPRYSKDENLKWELIRFCNKKYTSIVGGASKLFKYFKDNYLKEGEKIISYADRRHSMGNLYQNLGFKLSHISSPNYKYFHERNVLELHSRVSFQKHKLKEKLNIFDESLSETENMYNNGYRKIYDSGNLVYIFKK